MSNFYCAAPWRGLHINLDGDIRLCCAGRPGCFGNVKTDKLGSLTESPYLHEIRRDVKSGKLHSAYCKSCIENVGRGEREWFVETHADIDYETISVDEPHQFQSVDLRWNNTCNLSCTYCSPYFSSTWAKIEKAQSNQPPSKRFGNILDQIMNHDSEIKTMMLVGGEPLLIPHNERLLLTANSDTAVVLITNLAVPLLDNRVFCALEPLARVNWNVSFENIGSQFEFVRRGADWSLLTENLDILDQLFPRHTVSISAIYHVFNCTRLQEFITYVCNRNININWNTVSQDYLDPRFHDQSLRHLALQEIKSLLQNTSLDLTTDTINFFQHIQKELAQDQELPHVRLAFINHISKDVLEFQKLWPELTEIFT